MDRATILRIPLRSCYYTRLRSHSRPFCDRITSKSDSNVWKKLDILHYRWSLWGFERTLTSPGDETVSCIQFMKNQGFIAVATVNGRIFMLHINKGVDLCEPFSVPASEYLLFIDYFKGKSRCCTLRTQTKRLCCTMTRYISGRIKETSIFLQWLIERYENTVL